MTWGNVLESLLEYIEEDAHCQVSARYLGAISSDMAKRIVGFIPSVRSLNKIDQKTIIGNLNRLIK
jgi:hypothetical protein